MTDHHKESRGELRTRLTADGRWRAFIARRDQFVSEGHPKSDAHALAAQEFGPEPGPEDGAAAVAGPGEPSEVLDSPHPRVLDFYVAREIFEGKPTSRLREDILWVYNTLCISDVKPEDAPSSGAWALLVTTRQLQTTRAAFYKDLVSKLLPSKQLLDAEDRVIDESRNLRETIERLLGIRDAVLRSGTEGDAGEPEVAS